MVIVTVDSNFIDKDEKAGPFDVSDPRYGCFDPEIYKDDNQANFTFNFSEVPVYTWQLWDKYDMIYFKQYLFVWIVLNSLRGKWAPGPTKKGGAAGKNHISLNFSTHAPGFGEK